MQDVTTTSSLKGELMPRCHKCRNRVALLIPHVDRRMLCIDCTSAKDRAVFGKIGEDADVPVQDNP